MDEYEKLYYEFYGFEFLYSSGKVGKSKPMSKEKVMDISDECKNTKESPIIVKCRKCNEYMKFSKHWYQCGKCGSRIKESTLYLKIDKESRKDFGDDYNRYWN